MSRRRSVATSAAALAILAALACGGGPAGPAPAGRGTAVDPLLLAEDARDARAPALIDALADADPQRRALAVRALGRIQDPGSTPLLARAADDGKRELRRAALFALGQLGLATGATPPAEASRALEPALASTDPGIAALAVEALGKLAPDGAEATLIGLAGHSDPGVRAEAATALFRLRFVPLWRGLADAPPALSDEGAAALAAALRDADAGVRRAAAHAMSRFGEARALDALATATADEDIWVRMFALRAIGRSAGETPPRAAVEAIDGAFDDPAFQVRTEAAAAAAARGLGDRVPGALADDPSFHVRAAAVRAWGTGVDRATLDLLRGRLDDPSPTVRGAALQALAGRVGAEAGPAVAAGLDSEEWPVRVAATTAAARTGARAAALLRRALDDPDARVRAAAVGALDGVEGIENAGAWLDEALADDDLAVRGTAVDVVAGSSTMPAEARASRLRRAYDASTDETWIEVRESIVGALGPTVAADWLTTVAAADPAPSVRDRARTALTARDLPAPAATVEPPAPSPWLGVSFDSPPRIEVVTGKGSFVITTAPEAASVHVAAFVERVGKGFYDGLPWHRVVDNFVVQGGDPRGDGWGTGGVALRDEINRLRYVRGAVGMPKAGKDTGGCQLFIALVPTPHLDGNYTIFGTVDEAGMDVVDRLEVGDRIERMRRI